jgi:hypothetical protein
MLFDRLNRGLMTFVKNYAQPDSGDSDRQEKNDVNLFLHRSVA